MDNQLREVGHYWVIRPGSEPEIAYYSSWNNPVTNEPGYYCWEVLGSVHDYTDNEFIYISPEPIRFPGQDVGGTYPEVTHKK